ncbi:hypothetical protein GQ55_3G213600 [Panicum hallii var. hallii]|uniref:Receptor-like serine/threonine-protein kinase n=1 Tax=Panicum hallii var. hallii TaxID=1504633 RepID=A0A2T7EBV8_9POAL|nr:hypothetical protein GQ55_3G213600 [Panicum hallii var. hallii]PUZ65316.1 hypothetical protein GQ55_3G213600 [Panicum hallii var. hallii]
MGAVKRVFPLSRPRERALPTSPLVLLGCAFFAVAAFAGDNIVPGDGISGNETLVSKNGEFELGFFSPGDNIHFFLGVRFKKMPSTSPKFWVRNKVPITDLSASALEVFSGSLCIKEAGATLWCSSGAAPGPSPPAAAAVLLDNGNLVVRDQANSSRILWQSFDYPGDSLLPGARLGLDRDTGSNISMTYEHYPLNGSISVDQSRRNGFVLTTDGLDILGTFPDWMVTSQDNASSLVLNRPNPNVIEFLQLHLGQVSLMRWSEDSASANKSGWVARWTFPSDCKSSGFFCGSFGACTSNGKCGCLDGFEPSYPVEWGLGYFVTGCSRSLPLSCEANGQTEHNDSFTLIDKLQGLPYDPQDDLAESDEDCKQACFSNCYCVAYVYDSGCKLWYDKLYNMTFASRPPYSKVYVRWGSKLRAKNGLHTRAILLSVAGFIALASVILMLALLWRYRRDLFITCRKFEVEGSLVFYSYGQIKKATRNFSDKLGEGGFGSVFRGTMPGPGSTVIAVKSLKGRGHADKQFRAEVQTVGVIKHTNLVRLLGFCVKGDARLLVYEYMPNGSLESHLFSERSSLLNWDVRYRIALGIAKGLAYLHEGCEDCIIHCDIKPENILLDEEFCVKISDFGMAKLLGREFNSALTTIRGTIGYLAPEWISGQPITKQADVYSLGIVLLEIVSGRRTTKRLKFGDHRYFPLYAAAQVNEGNVMCLLDSRLEGNADVKELDITCRVACWCIQDDKEDRPSIGQVVRMLEGVVDTEIPPIPPSFHNLMEGEGSAIYSDEG